jgi:hypothetical protein
VVAELRLFWGSVFLRSPNLSLVGPSHSRAELGKHYGVFRYRSFELRLQER